MKTERTDLVLDSSAVVALVSAWHVGHQRVHDLVEGRLRQGHRLALAGHSLIEAYSVLTRLPTPYRISASDAHELLRKNFAEAPLLSLKSREYWQVLSECAEQGIAGGRVYDALIARTAQNGATPTIVTLNPKHFAAFESSELGIASPMDR